MLADGLKDKLHGMDDAHVPHDGNFKHCSSRSIGPVVLDLHVGERPPDLVRGLGGGGLIDDDVFENGLHLLVKQPGVLCLNT